MPMNRGVQLMLCGGASMILALGACSTQAQETEQSPENVVVTRSAQPREVRRVITTKAPPDSEAREVRIERKSSDGDEKVELWINGKKIDVTNMDDVQKALGEGGENIEWQIIEEPGEGQAHGMFFGVEPPEGDEAEGGDVRVFRLGDGRQYNLTTLGGDGAFTFSQPKAMLGVGLASISDDLRDYLGLADDAGVRVDSVVDGSPAAKAGLKQKDIIVAAKIGSESHDSISAADLRKAIAEAEPDTKVTLTILRKGNKQQVTATLAKWDAGSMGLSTELNGLLQLGSPQLFNGRELQIEAMLPQLREHLLELQPRIQHRGMQLEEMRLDQNEALPDREQLLKSMEQQMQQMQKMLDQLRRQQDQLHPQTERSSTPEA